MIKSPDTGQQIPCFDSCQFTITWMFSIKDVAYRPMDSHVTNKILEIYVLPSFLRHGAPLVRLQGAGAPLVLAGMIAVRISSSRLRSCRSSSSSSLRRASPMNAKMPEQPYIVDYVQEKYFTGN